MPALRWCTAARRFHWSPAISRRCWQPVGLTPQLRAGEARALHQGVELRPHNAGVDPAVKRPLGKAAIGSGKKIFASDQPRGTHDPLGDELRMFDYIGGMTDDAGNEQPVRRQFSRFPHPPFMFVTRIGALDDISADLHTQNEIDDVLERYVAGMRSGPAAPADMITDAV